VASEHLVRVFDFERKSAVVEINDIRPATPISLEKIGMPPDSGHPTELAVQQFAVALSPDGGALATTISFFSYSGAYRDKQTGRLVETQTSAPTQTRLWNVKTGKRLEEFESGPMVAFSPDGGQLAWGNRDGTITLRSMADPNVRKTLRRQSSSVSSVAFSPNGQRLVSGHGTSFAIWHVQSGEELLTCSSADDLEVAKVGWTLDGAAVAIQGHDGTVQIWDTP
jgi:WD40 repeat protein